MSAAVQDLIRSSSNRNTELLAALRETDHAASQLYQQINYLSDLDNQLRQSEALVKKLEAKTAAELADHKKYSESTFLRFAHKASGRSERFAEKAAKEEREYFDAILEQKSAQDQLEYLRQLRAEAEVEKQKFERETRRHDELHRELDALYASIFEGPTPGFPDEDEREHAVAGAQARCNQLSQALEREKHLLFLLGKVRAQMMVARRHLDKAHGASQMDMMGGGTFSSMRKRNYLEDAESALRSARTLQDQVRQVDASVANLGQMNIAMGSIWGDVIFDNIWTDMGMHDEIKKSERQVDQALARLAQHVRTVEGRIAGTGSQLQSASLALQAKREELQKAREEVFARVARGEVVPGADAPPQRNETPPPPIDEEAPPAYSA